MKIDVTPFFWEFVSQISTIPYEVLQTTHNYKIFQYYIDQDYTFSLTIEDQSIEFVDISELFYNTAQFCKLYYPNTQYDMLMRNAMGKIDHFIKIENDIDDIADEFMKL